MFRSGVSVLVFSVGVLTEYTINAGLLSLPHQRPNVFSTGQLVVTQSAAAGLVLAKNDPLLVPAAVLPHSADTDGDYRIGLVELTRVIELYNARKDTIRTGAYAVAGTPTEDGFATDLARPSGTVVTLARYHASDTNRDGTISLLELTRGIELYNYRAGTVRTGQYRVQPGTEDGFAPGP
jgi:hypothetical protein